MAIFQNHPVGRYQNVSIVDFIEAKDYGRAKTAMDTAVSAWLHVWLLNRSISLWSVTSGSAGSLTYENLSLWKPFGLMKRDFLEAQCHFWHMINSVKVLKATAGTCK